MERLAASCITASNKDRKVFFINNLDSMLGVFSERRVQSEEVMKFEELLLRQRELYVEEELVGFFSKLIAFVLETERKLSNASGSNDSRSGLVDEKQVETLVCIIMIIIAMTMGLCAVC